MTEEDLARCSEDATTFAECGVAEAAALKEFANAIGSATDILPLIKEVGAVMQAESYANGRPKLIWVSAVAGDSLEILQNLADKIANHLGSTVEEHPWKKPPLIGSCGTFVIPWRSDIHIQMSNTPG